MNRLVAVAIVPALVGCSSVGAHAAVRAASDAATSEAELTALRLRLDEQEQELRTLRGQLALARARVQELEASGRTEPPSSSEGSPSGGLPWANDRQGAPGMEPVLRLDGEVVDERLAVTSEVPDLPDLPNSAPPQASSAPKREPVSIEGYRRGLDFVRQQRFDAALVELDQFVSAHPGHAYADNALFWCGEIHYLRREYDLALEYFERLNKLHPWGNKAPDALYRMGQIHLRRGDTTRARSYFNKVREQFPDTAAARLALREDAS